MKKFLLILIVIIAAGLYGANRFLSLDGTGGQHALIVPGTDSKPLAMVTGATGKIGTELAHLLNKKGYRLIIHGRDEKKLKLLAETLNDAEIIAADFTIPEDRAKVVALITERTPDLLINNAAFVARGRVLATPVEVLTNSITINDIALTEFTIAAVKAMQTNQRQGIILNVSSNVVHFAPFPNYAVYTGTKSYVTEFSTAFDYELKGTGIRILTSHPGKVATRPGRDASKSSIISIPEAAQAIYHQIQNRLTQHTFNRTYRIQTMIAEFLPKNIKLWLVAKPREGEEPDFVSEPN